MGTNRSVQTGIRVIQRHKEALLMASFFPFLWVSSYNYSEVLTDFSGLTVS